MEASLQLPQALLAQPAVPGHPEDVVFKLHLLGFRNGKFFPSTGNSSQLADGGKRRSVATPVIMAKLGEARSSFAPPRRFGTRVKAAVISLRGDADARPEDPGQHHAAPLGPRIRRRVGDLELQPGGRTGRLAERRLPHPGALRQLHHHFLQLSGQLRPADGRWEGLWAWLRRRGVS